MVCALTILAPYSACRELKNFEILSHRTLSMFEGFTAVAMIYMMMSGCDSARVRGFACHQLAR
jgi:hypothetical protein